MSNVFVIPSWYPSELDPVSGIFVKNQCEAIAAYTKYNPIVALWGQCDENIPFNEILRIPAWFGEYCRKKDQVIYQESGVTYVDTKVLSWSHRLPLGGSNRLISSVRKSFAVAKERLGSIDLIHAYVAYPGGYLASLISKETGIPYIVTEFMGPFPFPAHRTREGKPRTEIVEALTGSQENIVLSAYLKRCFVEFHFPEPTVIPFSVNVDKFSIKKREADNVVRVVSCSRLVVEKGVFDLIEAFEQVWLELPNIRLTIIGSGPAEFELKRLVSDKGLSSVITFTGMLHSADVAKVFEQSDFFTLASHFDTFGVVFIEAMSSGLPILGTLCGGPDSFVTREQGVLVTPKNRNELANAMKEMALDFSTYNPTEIRRYALSQFSDEVVAGAVEEIYNRSAAQRG